MKSEVTVSMQTAFFAEELTLERNSETLDAFVFPYLPRLVSIKRPPGSAMLLKTVCIVEIHTVVR